MWRVFWFFLKTSGKLLNSAGVTLLNPIVSMSQVCLGQGWDKLGTTVGQDAPSKYSLANSFNDLDSNVVPAGDD
jgi:hypothetical protein